MQFTANEEYVIYGRLESYNSSDDIINLTISLPDATAANIKIKPEELERFHIGVVYQFHVHCIFNGTRNQLLLKQEREIFALDITEEVEQVLRHYYPMSPISTRDLRNKVVMYIAKIQNQNIKNIVNKFFGKYEREFLLYPAALKMHHAYLGGLAYHTITMCDMIDGFMQIYPFLNQDYLIAGILLHDITKVDEFKGPIDVEYSVRGQLVGHLVLAALEIERIAIELGIENSEEALVLQHLVISHHGQPQFGAAKKPLTPEALLIWFFDSIDSKMRVLSEEFEKIEEGTFTENLHVLDRTKFYKPKTK